MSAHQIDEYETQEITLNNTTFKQIITNKEYSR